jgi:hypothetical protein
MFHHLLGWGGRGNAENSSLSSPNCGSAFKTTKYLVMPALLRFHRLKANCFQTEMFTEKIIHVSEIEESMTNS